MGIKYVKTSGSVAVVSNGGGIGMATMDQLISMGGSVSSCSDVGGKIIHEQVETLLDILGKDVQTKVIFINCFCGSLQEMIFITAIVTRAI
jgi:succinyl-CoA synthetase beta subunit